MLKNLFYDILVIYHADDFHLSRTFRARQWVHFIDFLDQSGPVFPVFIGRPVRLKDGWDQIALLLSFALTTAHVTIVTIIPDHLFPPVGDMGTPVCVPRTGRHCRQPFQGVKYLLTVIKIFGDIKIFLM